MNKFGIFVFVLAFCFWIIVIFADQINTDLDPSIVIYDDKIGGSQKKVDKIMDLEKELAVAYQDDSGQAKIQAEIEYQNQKVIDKISMKNLKNINPYQKEVIQEPEKLVYPDSFDLQNVPFYSQAPYGNWNEPYQNACEEASILLAYYYVVNEDPTRQKYKNDLLNLMAWEQNNLGHHKDTTIEEFLFLIKEFLNIKDGYIITNPTVDQIKYQISQGNIIIAPFRGKEIGNPHYSLGGPEYHVMVIKGYDQNNFITKDVGTIRGNDRKYSVDTIMNAMSNGNKKQLDNPEKRIIVLNK